MTFEEEIGGTDALRALKLYTEKLKEKYDRKAFKHFSDADMRILASSTM